MELLRFYAWIIKIGILLALCGELRTCTLQMMHLAAGKTEVGIMSYSKFSHALTD